MGDKMEIDSPLRQHFLTYSSLSLPVLLFIQKQANAVPHCNLLSDHRWHKAGFLNLNTMEIWAGKFFLEAGGGGGLHCRKFSSTPDLYPLWVVAYLLSLLSQPEMFSRYCQITPG